MDVLGTKVVVLILFLLIKLGSGLLPLLLDKVLQIKKVCILLLYMSLFVNSYLSLLISSAIENASPKNKKEATNGCPFVKATQFFV